MAKVSKVEVKVNDKVIGEVEVTEFDNVQEAVTALTEKRALKMLNARLRSEITNKARMAYLQDSPEKQIARIARAAKKGDLSKDEAAKKISALLPQLTAQAANA